MGHANAHRALVCELAQSAPAMVVSSGFAGGLDPSLAVGQVVMEAPEPFPLWESFRKAGAIPGRFHCSPSIAATRQTKAHLREHTGADAVEMESGIIHEACRAGGLPCATVRVISDDAHESLPLDFGALMDLDMKLKPARLALALCRRPWRLPRLIAFHWRIQRAAGELARVLAASCGQSAP